MITLLAGENSFEIARRLARLKVEFGGKSETHDGSELTTRDLPDLIMGVSLFSEKRLVIIKNLSENKSLWSELSEWLPRVSDDIHLVLVEPKPDKRTKTYKDIQKVAKVEEHKHWTERDRFAAEKWVGDEMKHFGGTIDRKSASLLVARVGVDQWALFHALEKLSVLDEVTPAVIEQVIDLAPSENVFNLFETALRGDAARVQQMVQTLALTEEPYKVFGLLNGQAFQLAALAVANKSQAEVAKDLGAHPFALGKLAPYAKKLGKPGAKKIIDAFAAADESMKTSGTEPWLLIERTLIEATSN